MYRSKDCCKSSPNRKRCQSWHFLSESEFIYIISQDTYMLIQTWNRIVIFISLYTTVPRTHILDIVFLSIRSSHQDAVKLFLVLWTLVVARGRGTVSLRWKIWEHYLQNNWAFFLSLHCFFYQILWKLTNKVSFSDNWIRGNPKDCFRLCIPTIPALYTV